MPAVLVHGVPETERVWDQLRAELSRSDVVALSLPGFGYPLPDGFRPTMDGYAAWLIGELESIDEPVDLVGHDWGGGFALRAVSLRPDLVRSWVTDAAGLADAEGFHWHDFARLWQTPGDGEAFMDVWLTQTDEERSLAFTSQGAPPETAMAMAAGFDRVMADAILALYRSGVRVHEEWGPDFVDIAPPGLVVIPSEDPYLEEGSARRAAARAGAEVVVLDGLSHWWLLSDPAAGAAVLERFWSRLSGR